MSDKLSERDAFGLPSKLGGRVSGKHNPINGEKKKESNFNKNKSSFPSSPSSKSSKPNTKLIQKQKNTDEQPQEKKRVISLKTKSQKNVITDIDITKKMKNMKDRIEASNRASIVRKSIAQAEALVPDLSSGSVMRSHNDNIALEIELNQQPQYVNNEIEWVESSYPTNNSNKNGNNDGDNDNNSSNNEDFNQGVKVGQVLSPTFSATAGVDLQYTQKPSFGNSPDRNNYNNSSSARASSSSIENLELDFNVHYNVHFRVQS